MIGKVTPLDEIANIDVVRPDNAGNKWKGLRHIDLIESMTKLIQYNDMEIISQGQSVSEDGTSLIGYYQVDGSMPEIAGQRYTIGYRHSNDMKHSITLSIGTTVMICHNGVITGEYIIRRKHTKNLNIEAEMFGAIQTVKNELFHVQPTIDYMRQKDMTYQYASLLLQGARQKLYPWSWIGKIDSECCEPSDDNPECDNSTAWGIYNGFNYVMRESNPERQYRSLHRFSELITG